MFSQERAQARSMVITRLGIVATSHVQASQAGAQVLARGGTAADAIIAANAVLAVTEPMMNGIGGDLFALYWDAKDATLSGLNASGWAPKELTIEQVKRGSTMSAVDSITVPGAVEGWNQLHRRFGRLPWEQLFQPAIFYAEQGYPVPELIHGFWVESAQRLAGDSEGCRVFLPQGRPPAIGEVFRNPEFAKALRLLARGGAEAFYRGEIARSILDTVQPLGGTMRADDLAEFCAEWVPPISTTYRGWTVYELPPNAQGMAVLEMLNIMEISPASPEGPLGAAELHKRIEAMRLAYADLLRFNADPRFVEVPLKALLSKEYAEQRARSIETTRASSTFAAGAPAASDTTYLCAVDREGNIASLIESNYMGFGAGIVVRGMGFPLQNRGAMFSLDPSHPNALAPRKRPFHTIIPGFMERGDQRIPFGIMGGANQPLAHAQFVSNFVDYGMNLQEALETARFTVSSHLGSEIVIEGRVKPDVLARLSEMGHKLDVKREYSTSMGRGQAVLHDEKTGINHGASDPRADGSAEPEPPALAW